MARAIKRYRATLLGLDWLAREEDRKTWICRFCGCKHCDHAQCARHTLCDATLAHAFLADTGACWCCVCDPKAETRSTRAAVDRGLRKA